MVGDALRKVKLSKGLALQVGKPPVDFVGQVEHLQRIFLERTALTGSACPVGDDVEGYLWVSPTLLPAR